ncbi:ferrous iron transporter B [Hydromonas duriensis]|uniref:Fe(2+) transporter FeoB n=1 Tax=Hydromonas duriensis TaxID=1527608 RepID=A0A4R6Y6X7_9BURK|nr:ferrous iron transporter B [Hydromonas duriensis]TDR29088.1 ferrous iron transport protein B [Hydromonas duriensis]
MNQSNIQFYPSGTLVALVGNPNCGKTALFNLLTGSRQKVANYAGVTVERKEGAYLQPDGKKLRILDLPGTYSLYPRSPDEKVTCDVLAGKAKGEKRPDYVVCVVSATNLRRGLRLVLSVKRMGLPVVVALNMTDVAQRRGIKIDEALLSTELGLPVVSTVGVKTEGVKKLEHFLNDLTAKHMSENMAVNTYNASDKTETDGIGDHATVRTILNNLGLNETTPHQLTEKLDSLFLNPIWGSLILATILFMVFQAVFSWAELPMGLIETMTAGLGEWVGSLLPDGIIRSFLVDGLIAGLGGVVVFLPQIVILFFFILLLEESGYLPRAALLLDRLMGSVGLSGRSFIPLLSSFACAIPGIMAARTIPNPRDRLVTILIAPLMTCSARLPVYALLIGAFIPEKQVWGGFEQQGIALFVLYFAGILGAFAVAWVLKRFGNHQHMRTLMMELPDYHWPNVRNLLIGLWQRVDIFMRRVGGIILTLTIVMWFLASFPSAPDGAVGAPIEYSFAGTLGRWLNVLFAPIGFNWQISIALIPGLAAREVLVSALATVYALSSGDDGGALMPIIASQWSTATALSLLAWFVFAPQCLSTIATIKRETGGWKMALITAGYLFALAYLASFVTYRVALSLGL